MAVHVLIATAAITSSLGILEAAQTARADDGPIVAVEPASTTVVDVSDDGGTLLLQEASSSARLIVSRPAGWAVDTSFRVESAALSGDGQNVIAETTVAVSAADVTHATDLYRRRGTGAYELVTPPALAGAARIIVAGVSDDGRYVALSATSPVTLWLEAWVADLDTGTAWNLTPTVTDYPGVFGSTGSPAISDDGRTVAFIARGARTGCSNCAGLVYRWDRTTNRSTMVSSGASGPANGYIGSVDISGDGSTIAFSSSAPNLDVPAAGLTPMSIHVRRVGESGPSRLRVDRSIQVLGSLDVSDDGQIVAYNALDGPSPGRSHVFVYDRGCEYTEVVSQPNDLTAWADGPASGLRLSGDGLTVAFTSTAANLTDVARPGPAPYVVGTPGCPAFTPATPFRALDTRVGSTTVDGIGAGAGLRPAGSVTELPLRGRNGIPPRAVAAIVNITVTEAAGPGFLTVFPCDAPRPTAANLNFQSGIDVGSNVVARVSAAGSICIYTYAATHLVADVAGWFLDGGGFTPLSPRRIVETRPGEPATVDGIGSGIGRLTAGETLRIPLRDRAGLDRRVGAVVLNVAAVDPLADGFLTVYPCDAPRPTAASVNFVRGRTVSNTVVVGVPATADAFAGAPTGTADVCVYTHAATDLVVDLSGSFDAFAAVTADSGALVLSPLLPVTPARLLDTRVGQPTIDGRFSGQGLRLPDQTLRLDVAGRGGVPTGATAVVLNVVAALDLPGDGYPPGYVTAFPCDQDRPLASSLNYRNHAITGNNVIAPLAADGTVCLYTYRAADLVVDVTGALF